MTLLKTSFIGTMLQIVLLQLITYKDMAEKNCRLITFYTLEGKNWHMKCHRSYLQSLKIGFRHIFKGHAIAFSIKKL